MDARRSGWSEAPIVEMLIPSVLDDTLAPPGRHVASLFCQHVAPKLPDGRSWDEARETVADLMIDAVEAYAPGFKASVIARKILTPLDLERDFGLVGGDIFHGCLSLDQLYSARPVLGHADYRSPVPGLYMCGASTHPGGGVSGMPGHNAAREILKDFRRRRLRRGGAGVASLRRAGWALAAPANRRRGMREIIPAFREREFEFPARRAISLFGRVGNIFRNRLESFVFSARIFRKPAAIRDEFPAFLPASRELGRRQAADVAFPTRRPAR